MKSTKETAINQTIETKPSYTRLIIWWSLLFVVIASLTVVWGVFTKNISTKLVLIVVAFLVVFFAAGMTITLFNTKHTTYVFSKTEIIASTGIVEILSENLPYSAIKYYRKYFHLPDLIERKKTACFAFYTLKANKKGKQKIVKNMVCSAKGISNHDEISKLLESKKIQKLISVGEVKIINKKLAQNWKEQRKTEVQK